MSSMRSSGISRELKAGSSAASKAVPISNYSLTDFNLTVNRKQYYMEKSKKRDTVATSVLLSLKTIPVSRYWTVIWTIWVTQSASLKTLQIAWSARYAPRSRSSTNDLMTPSKYFLNIHIRINQQVVCNSDQKIKFCRLIFPALTRFNEKWADICTNTNKK